MGMAEVELGVLSKLVQHSNEVGIITLVLLLRKLRLRVFMPLGQIEQLIRVRNKIYLTWT